jgi:hypothetical protein
MLGGFFGAFLFGETEQYFTNWYNNSGYYGRITLDQVFGIPTGWIVLGIVMMALFMFWGAEQLEHLVGKRDLSKEPKLRVAGAVVLLVLALGVVFIGSPSLEQKYSKRTFTRTESIPQLQGDPITTKVNYTADQMLEKRLVQVTPEELFKTRYNQAINLIMLDVRDEADYNLYHINGAANVPLDQLQDKVPALLSEPPANSVFVVMSNDEEAATRAWKLLAAEAVPNVYILEGGLNNWIKVFGTDEGFKAVAAPAQDQLNYVFPSALGSKYASCDPNPVEYENLDFVARIKLELKRDKSGGGCG